jgi:hypothetical protein
MIAVIGQAHGLKTEALIKLGELLQDTPKAKGADRGGHRRKVDGTRRVPSTLPPTLASWGVNKKLAHVADRAGVKVPVGNSYLLRHRRWVK